MNNKELWFFIFFTGILLFSWPFLDIFNMVLPYYLFGMWGAFIACVGVFISRTGKQNKGV